MWFSRCYRRSFIIRKWARNKSKQLKIGDKLMYNKIYDTEKNRRIKKMRIGKFQI